MALKLLKTNVEKVEKRKRHFLRKRLYAEEFRERGLDDVAYKLEACEETELLVACSHCGKHWWVVNHCRLRVCPLCSWKVAHKRAMYLKLMTRQMLHPKMITLTMPLWKKDPRKGIAYLRTQFNRLRKTKFFKTVAGGAYQIELKPSGEHWHIHMHIMVDAPFMPYQKLFSAWKKILDCKAPEVDIRSASTDKQKEYLVKDASKSASFEMHPDRIVDWYVATKGLRLFATFGKWYNKRIEELDTEEELFKPSNKCPYCGEEGTVFFARDGPFIFGGESWNEMQGFVTGDEDWQRDMDPVIKMLDEYEERSAIKMYA